MKTGTRTLVAAGVAVMVAVPLDTSTRAFASAVIIQDEAAAIASDLAATAEAMGWTLAQARAQYDAGRRLDRVREAVAATQGERAIVGGVLPEKPDGTATLLIAGAASDEVRRLAAAGDVRVADEQPYTAQELDKRASTVHDRLLKMGYREVVTGVDIVAAGVLATVKAKAGLPATREALAAALPDDLDNPADGVVVTVSDGPVTQRQTVAFGGMRNRLTGVNACTSGFSVIAPDGTTGVSTAGHCGVNQIVHDNAVHNVALQAQHIGSQGDVEWGTTTVPEPDDFFASSTEVRDVSAVEPIGNITVNEAVRVYGRSTNAQRSTTVSILNVTVTDSFGTSKRLIATTDAVTQGGDSGAPWFNGTVAFGSHVGTATFSDNTTRSLFQVADLYDEALGVRVRTTS